MNKLPVVAIIGRMNVGKSTLFNRLSSSVKSITLDYAGVTRDVIRDVVSWQGRTFELVDTGGITFGKHEDKLLAQVRDKALLAVQEAQLVVLVVDGIAGLRQEDREIARYLHKLGKKVLLVINKADSHELQQHAYEFNALGFPDQLIISAQHGTGVGDLLNIMVDSVTPTNKVIEKPRYRVMLLGRPNVGKSSLINALTKQDRSIVSDQPGTTREAISERVVFYKEHIDLIDTPGIRRKRAVDTSLESMMVQSSLQTLKESDIMLLLLDAQQGDIVDQELKLGFYAFQDYNKALVLLINKDDIATELTRSELATALDFYKHLIDKIPVLYISCKTGKNIGKIMPLVNEVWARYSKRIADEEINRLFISTLQRKPLMHNGQPLRLIAAKQVATAPLTIVLEVTEPTWFGDSQLKFFENLLRAEYDLRGVPVKFIVRHHKDAF